MNSARVTAVIIHVSPDREIDTLYEIWVEPTQRDGDTSPLPVTIILSLSLTQMRHKLLTDPDSIYDHNDNILLFSDYMDDQLHFSMYMYHELLFIYTLQCLEVQSWQYSTLQG